MHILSNSTEVKTMNICICLISNLFAENVRRQYENNVVFFFGEKKTLVGLRKQTETEILIQEGTKGRKEPNQTRTDVEMFYTDVINTNHSD